MRSVWKFATSGQLIFGRGAAGELAAALAGSEVKRALLVCDPVLEELGYTESVAATLRDVMQVAICNAGRAEPSVNDAEVCIAKAHEVRPEMIIGLGGGSNLDLAKITATVMAHGGSPADYFGFDRIPGPILPVAALPTTAGTGSEVSHSAVLTDTASGIKVSTLSRHLRPDYAVVDPRFTDSCPQTVTADSGIDALVHAVEAYTARRFDEMENVAAEARAYEGAHPLGRTLAAEAIRLIGRNLVRAVEHPDDREARDAMALAATYAGMAFSNCGVALVHGLEYPLGALVHCSHGAGNGSLLPYVMKFNLPERTTEIAEIGSLLGLVQPGVSVSEQAQATVEAVTELRRRIGIPDRLREFGLKEEHLTTIAEKTSKIERLMTLNPRSASEADLLDILTAAY